MFKKMKLTTKIGTGFGILIVLAGILGYVAWNGQRHLATTAELNQEGQECLNGINQCGSLRREFAIRGYEKYGDDSKTAAENWQAAYDALNQRLQRLEVAKDLAGKDKAIVTEALGKMSPYRTSFDHQKEARSMRDEAFATWRKVGGDVTQEIAAVLTGVIDPARKAAEQTKDANELIRWSTIGTRLDESVFQEFLVLRVTAVYLLATNKEEQWTPYQKQLAKVKANLDAWSTLAKGNEKLEQVAQNVSGFLKTYEESGLKYHAGMEAQQSSDAEMAAVAKGIVDTIGRLRTSLDDQMTRQEAWTNTLVLTMAISSIVLGIVLAVTITLSIVRPIKRIITALNEGAEQVTAASTQVAAASQSLAEGATEQAASLEETSSSLEQMSSQTKQNAGNAQQANGLAAEAKSAAQNGAESMGRMSTAIKDIQKSSDETAKIIKVIDEIAFQTNLLALNAAVEAARAGEAGKGFAVVAEEVRNLAMRSAEAAKNTARLIEESVKNSQNGVANAGEVSKILDEIMASVGKTTDLVGEIAAASQDQAQGIDQINTAVGQMDKVTQQNAANAEESASASEELSAQAESMNGVIQELVALVGGSSVKRQNASSQPKATAHHAALHADRGLARRTREVLGKTGRSLSASDRVFHKIAEKTNPSVSPQPVCDPEQIIPLNKKDDFSGFNG